MATLWIEPFGGLAGDMLLAALLDLEDPRFGLGELRGFVEGLIPGECELGLERTRRGGIAARRLEVRTPETARPPARRYAELAALVGGSALSPAGRGRALAVLWRLAVAEGAVHARAPEEVHFHELAAVDTLVDVCGAAFALERLGVERVHAGPPLLGEGTVRCAHGELPVPPPAVAEILRGLAARPGGGPGERLTPTGAAILREWVDEHAPPERFTAHAIGYGAGTRDSDHGPPNLARVKLGEAAGEASRQLAWQLEVNLDDATGEEVAWCLEGLREAGALDAWALPVQMKKGRPGVVLSALCREGQRATLEAVLFERSPTLGVRWLRVERTECGRETLEVEVCGQCVRVKRRVRPAYPGASPAGERDLSPEYDDLVRAARATGVGLRELERRAIAAALELPGDPAG